MTPLFFLLFAAEVGTGVLEALAIEPPKPGVLSNVVRKLLGSLAGRRGEARLRDLHDLVQGGDEVLVFIDLPDAANVARAVDIDADPARHQHRSPPLSDAFEATPGGILAEPAAASHISA